MSKGEIRLTWGHIQNQSFWSALNSIMSQKFDFKTGLKVLNIRKKAEAEFKKSQEMIKALRDQYCDKGEDGKLVVKEGQKEALDKAEDEFADTFFFVNVNKITLDELMQTKLSAAEIQALAPIIEMPPEEVVPAQDETMAGAPV